MGTASKVFAALGIGPRESCPGAQVVRTPVDITRPSWQGVIWSSTPEDDNYLSWMVIYCDIMMTVTSYTAI